LAWFGNSNRSCRGALHQPRGAYAQAMKRNFGGKKMTDGEIAYITLVLVLFVAFLVVIGAATQTQDKRENR
jgi:hypothetical protein